LVNRKKVKHLLQLMGISTLYPKANTSRPGKGHRIYPLPAESHEHRQAEPGMGNGHLLRADGHRLCVRGGHHGLVQPQDTGLAGIRISMDGKGRWVDNVFVERLWCSLKYEEVYLKAYETVAQDRQGMGNYFRFYNRERRHQSLDRQTPDQVYEWSEMWPVAA